MVDLSNGRERPFETYTEYPLPLRVVQSGDLEEFVKLVHSNVDPVQVLNCAHAKSGDTPLIVAARRGHLDLLKFLVLHGVDIEQRNKDLKRALHEAAAGSHLDCVKLLLSRNAVVDSLKRADWYGRPLLDT